MRKTFEETGGKWLSHLLTIVFLVAGAVGPAAAAGGSDHDRIEGVVEAIQSPNAVRVRTPDRVITVDLTALGGVTAAVTPGERIVAVGTMEPGDDIFRANRLETPGHR